MHETSNDLRQLQDLLDRSFASMGEHMRSIITPDRRISAEELATHLTGMRLLRPPRRPAAQCPGRRLLLPGRMVVRLRAAFPADEAHP